MGKPGGRGQLDSSRLPDDLCHRDVTISEALDFAWVSKMAPATLLDARATN